MKISVSEIVTIDGVQLCAGQVLFQQKIIGTQSNNEVELTEEGALALNLTLAETHPPFIGDSIADLIAKEKALLENPNDAIAVAVGEVNEIAEKEVKVARRARQKKGE